MNMSVFTFLFSLLAGFAAVSPSNAQTIPSDRRVDWTLAGAQDTSTTGFHVIDLGMAGAIGDGVTPNDRVMDSVLQIPFEPGAIFRFPPGRFVFHRSIRLPSQRVLRGAGAEYTRLIFNLGGSGHAISVAGKMLANDTTHVIQDAVKAATSLQLHDATLAQRGDWLYLSQSDSDRVTSGWALGSTGQIVQVAGIDNNSITLSTPMRHTYELSRFAKVTSLESAGNAGIECLAIERLDDTAPQQSCNIHFRYANNCWVYGIESFNTTFAHVAAEFSSNISVRASYMHHAFDYGGGGRGYGVVLHLATGECRVDDNIFEHLRHSMLLQAGANGNVFAYNYSTDPHWESGNPLIPANSAGDIVLHGNYTYANLFEHNICQNIVIDDSHGPNGPHNTIFRNRAELFGIFFSASNSPSLNIVGNEIPNTSLPYNLVNYTIRGDDHFLHGNNNKGSIVPLGSSDLPDTSYAYAQTPLFLNRYPRTSIGTPHTMGTGSIPAADRYTDEEIFAFSCMGGGVSFIQTAVQALQISIYPNPAKQQITIRLPDRIDPVAYVITDLSGRQLLRGYFTDAVNALRVSRLGRGMYFIHLPGLGAYRFSCE